MESKYKIKSQKIQIIYVLTKKKPNLIQIQSPT